MKTSNALAGAALAAVVGLPLLFLLGTRHAGAAAAPTSPAVALTVTTAVAQTARWPVTLEASGAVAPWEEASIGAQVGGLMLREVRVNVGDAVRRGQVLARFDAQMLQSDETLLMAQLRQAQALAAQADANRNRALQLQGSGGISNQDVLQAVTQADTAQAQVAAAQAQLASKRLQLGHATVLAPDDGVISARSATVGAVAPSGQELFRLIRQNRLEWRGEVTAAQLTRIAPGQRIELSLPDGNRALGRVRQLAPSLAPATRLGTVYADLEPRSSARAGMYARGRFVLADSPAVVLPAASVVIRDGHDYVFGLQGRTETARVSLRPVTVGRRQGTQVEIVQGLAVGDRLVVQGAGFLNDGDMVRIAPAPAAVPANGRAVSDAAASAART